MALLGRHRLGGPVRWRVGSAPRGDGSGQTVTHERAVTIRQSVDVVARYVFDPTTMPQWSGVLYEIEPVADLEPRRGRHLRANLKILGVRLTVEGELIELDLDARQAAVRIVPVGGGGSIEHRLSVEGSRRRSVVRFWNRVETPGWLASSVSDRLIYRFLDHTATFALANIRDILELGEEENVRRLETIASRDVLAPARLQTGGPGKGPVGVTDTDGQVGPDAEH
jgi:hypothetical protein